MERIPSCQCGVDPFAPPVQITNTLPMINKHIVIVAYSLVPTKVGGVETYFNNIVPALLRNIPDHFKVSMVIGSAAKEYADRWCEWGGRSSSCIVSNRFPCINSISKRAYALGKALLYSRPLEREIHEIKPDMVFFPLTVCVPLLIRRRRRFPVATTVHDVLHVVRPEWFNSKIEKIYRLLSYGSSISQSNAILVPSRYTAGTVQRHFGKNPTEINCIPYGLDHDVFSCESRPSDAEVLERYRLDGQKIVIYPANTWPHKNHKLLFKAWECCLPSLPQDAWLILCGRVFDPLPSQSCLLNKRIRHIGFISQEDLSALYRSAHAVVFPSLFEGFGAPPLEAMASGAVTICSQAASLAEVLPDRYPLAFAPESMEQMSLCILKGCIDEMIRTESRLLGKRHSMKFSWDIAAKRHIECFERILRNGE